MSDDGRWLGLRAARGGPSQVYVLRRDTKGAAIQRATSDTSSSYWVAWSPDEKEIAFHRFRSEKRQVCVSPVEGGTAPRTLSIGIGADTITPGISDWSPTAASSHAGVTRAAS